MDIEEDKDLKDFQLANSNFGIDEIYRYQE